MRFLQLVKVWISWTIWIVGVIYSQVIKVSVILIRNALNK